MKKGHIVELVIDAIMLLVGLVLPFVATEDAPVLICSIGLLLCSGLEFIEYIFNKERRDSIFMGLAALISILIITLLEIKYNFALGVAFIVFTVLSGFIKVFSLKDIKVERTRLFKLKYIFIGLFALIGVLVSIAAYYKVYPMVYLFSILILCFALQELLCDLVTYVDEVKEVFKR